MPSEAQTQQSNQGDLTKHPNNNEDNSEIDAANKSPSDTQEISEIDTSSLSFRGYNVPSHPSHTLPPTPVTSGIGEHTLSGATNNSYCSAVDKRAEGVPTSFTTSTMTEHSSLGYPKFQQALSSARSTQPQPFLEKLQNRNVQTRKYPFGHSLNKNSSSEEIQAYCQKRQRKFYKTPQAQTSILSFSSSATNSKRPRKKPVSPDMAEQILKKMSVTACESKKKVIDDDLFGEIVQVWIDVHFAFGIDPGDEESFKHWFKNQKKFFRIIDESIRNGDCQFNPEDSVISFSSDENRKVFVEKYKHLVSDIGEKIKKPYTTYLLIKDLDMKRLSSKQTISVNLPMSSASEFSISNSNKHLKARKLDTTVSNPTDNNESSVIPEFSDPAEKEKSGKSTSHFEGFETLNYPGMLKSRLNYARPCKITENTPVSFIYPSHSHVSAHAPEMNFSSCVNESSQISFLQVVDEMEGFTKDEKARFLSLYMPFKINSLFQPVSSSKTNDIKRLMRYTIYCMKKKYVSNTGS